MKANVIEYRYLDGVLLETKVHRDRAVYVKKDGTATINYLYGKHTVIKENGFYVWHCYAKTIKGSGSLADVLNHHFNNVEAS